MFRTVTAIVAASAIVALASDAFGDTFTYQGVLRSDGAPFTGTAQLTFRLFETSIGGPALASELVISDAEIIDGLVTADLDFGAGVFDGSPRFIEIAIDGVTLAPRQALHATPYALFAMNGNEGPAGPQGATGVAGSIGPQGPVGAPGDSHWSINGSATYYASGSVGIGPSSPLARLHVRAAGVSLAVGALNGDDAVLEDIDAILGLYSNAAGVAGSTLVLGEVNGGVLASKWSLARETTAGGGGLRVSYNTDSEYFDNPLMYFSDSLRVGIGTTDPQYTLDVSGNLGAIQATLGNGSNGTPLQIVPGSLSPYGIFMTNPTLGGDGIRIVCTNNGPTSSAECLDVVTAATNGVALRAQANGSNSFGIHVTAARNYLSGGLGLGTTAPTSLLHVNGLGSPTGGDPSEDNVVARFRQSGSGEGTALSIDALSGQDATIYFAENGTATWSLFADSSAQDFVLFNEDIALSAMTVTESAAGFDFVMRGDVLPLNTNTFTLGNSSAKWASVWALNGVIQTSDARCKQAVRTLDYGLAEVLAMRPVSYEWTDDASAGRQLGLIAQEVRELVPEAIIEGDDAERTLAMSYTTLVPVLTKAIQEQQAIIERLEARLEQLERAASHQEVRR
ncbi:MAG: tail fiber domain-containing protein [Phycisphaerae bacterium]|nr:tail fiber domain-containing protein [Phycisphaerae bacterium]